MSNSARVKTLRRVQPFGQAGINAAITSVSNWIAAFGEKERECEVWEHPEIMED